MRQHLRHIRISVVIALLCLCANQIGAQSNTAHHDIPDYKCIHFHKNKIETYSNDANVRKFYMKLDSLLNFKGKSVNIVHIGGSHVQADALTNTLRKDLIALNYDITGNRGILFPYYLGKTNRPGSYRMRPIGNWDQFSSNVKYNLPDEPHGITGMIAVAKENNCGLTLKLNTDSSNTWQMRRLQVLGRASSDGVRVYTLSAKGDTVWAHHDKESHLYTLSFPQTTDTASILLKIPEGEQFILTGLMPMNPKRSVTVHSLGVNGAALTSWLRCGAFSEEVAMLNADLVILGVGVNDANVPAANFNPDLYKSRYRELMARFKAVNPNVAFLFITNNDCYKNIPKTKKGTNPNTAKVQKAMHELAKEEGAAVWDLYEIMGGYGSSSAWVKQELMRTDHIHFTSEGYQLLGHMLFNAMMDKYSYYFKH